MYVFVCVYVWCVGVWYFVGCPDNLNYKLKSEANSGNKPRFINSFPFSLLTIGCLKLPITSNIQKLVLLFISYNFLFIFFIRRAVLWWKKHRISWKTGEWGYYSHVLNVMNFMQIIIIEYVLSILAARKTLSCNFLICVGIKTCIVLVNYWIIVLIDSTFILICPFWIVL